ncbi:MAG: class I SAM-dependent methyltransferase [Burkholderiales bacterium]|nr:class I SAM-dependent methyltransferase [Burkholderiales bacterium]
MGAITSNSGYAEAAQTLAGQYEALSFEQVHAPVLALFPAPPAAVLDIGAGSGRDAAALARRGHRVTAAEPTQQLRAYGEQAHAALGIRWMDDMLPNLPAVRALGERFDLILLTAVWMHLEEGERDEAMAALAALLAPGGRISMSLRHGPVPEGRRMFEVSAEETTALARRHGLAAVHSVAAPDAQGRADVRWTFLVLQACQTP